MKAKMFSIFKRDGILTLHNYRGINVINSIASLYEMVLGDRLAHWFWSDLHSSSLRRCGKKDLLCKMTLTLAIKISVSSCTLRGRLVVEERLCLYGRVQTEMHVV